MHFSRSISKALSSSVEDLIRELSLRRVLVALSGGPDSQALLFALTSCKKDLDIGVAHVDHNWREESGQEAGELKKQVEALGLPLYLKELNSQGVSGNMEEVCRRERYQFFKEICERENYQAVFLGHHRDDLAETILKRILEGASLSAMGGMKKISTMNGILVLRPFLDIPKNDLIQVLQSQRISFFEDKTNWDTRFLRGKFRKNILPGLNEEFGKSVNEPLARFGKECIELNEFMEKKFARYLVQKEILDFSLIESKFETRWLVRAWLKKQRLNPSYAVLDDLAEMLKGKKGDKSFFISGKRVEVDRGRIFLMLKDLPVLSGRYFLNEAHGKWNDWHVHIEPLVGEEKEVVGWEAAWKGRLQFCLPDGDFSLNSYLDLSSQEKKMLQKIWTKEKIPAFFRKFVPVVSKRDCLIREFLLNSKGSAVKKTASYSKKVILYLE